MTQAVFCRWLAVAAVVLGLLAPVGSGAHAGLGQHGSGDSTLAVVLAGGHGDCDGAGGKAGSPSHSGFDCALSCALADRLAPSVSLIGIAVAHPVAPVWTADRVDGRTHLPLAPPPKLLLAA
jgi:hypothetical protein